MYISESTPLSDLMEYANKELEDLNDGEKFVMKDLFKGYEWKRITRGNRTKLGMMFFEQISRLNDLGVEPLGKTPQNQQEYRKVNG